jgi:hypothetical protein
MSYTPSYIVKFIKILLKYRKLYRIIGLYNIKIVVE